MCGCLHTHDMQNPGSSEAFSVHLCACSFPQRAAALDNPHALFWDAASAPGLRKWPSVSSCCLLRAVLLLPRLAALRALLEGNSFQPLDATLAALLFPGIELVGHFTLFSGIGLVGHFAQLSRHFLEGRFKKSGWQRPVGHFCKGTLKDEESIALPVSLVASKVYFQVSTSGTLAGNFLAPVLRQLCDGETPAHHQLQRRQGCRRCGVCSFDQSSSRI